jgi:hypothetical protein
VAVFLELEFFLKIYVYIIIYNFQVNLSIYQLNLVFIYLDCIRNEIIFSIHSAVLHCTDKTIINVLFDSNIFVLIIRMTGRLRSSNYGFGFIVKLL